MAEDEKAKSKSLAGPLIGFAAGLITAGAGIFSGVLDREVRDREVDVEVMRVAFDVLQLPKEQAGVTYRRWACEVLNAHTTPELDCDAADAENAVLGDLGTFRSAAIGDRAAGDPKATDIGVYVCEDSDMAPARAAGAALREAGFGTITFRRWNLFSEAPRDALSGATTIIYDADHPEATEVERLETALNDGDFAPIRRRENTGGVSPWFISVILCDKG